MIRIVGRLSRWVRHTDPWTNVYGMARTLLATGTGLTLALCHSTTLFRPATGAPIVPFPASGLARISLFVLIPRDHLELARWIAVALLAVVASGWRPRLTGPVHWWISFSLHISALLVDGGDQVTEVLTLLLLPIALTDSRRWHWSKPSAEQPAARRDFARLVALSAWLVIRLQVAGIYFHAAIGKLRVAEWENGTAVYYWLTDPSFGAPSWISPVLEPLLTTPWSGVLLTWGPMLLELLLFMALVMPRRVWGPLLLAGLGFHFLITLLHGLPSFGFAMSGALVLYLRPINRPFAFLRREAAPSRLGRAEEPAAPGAGSMDWLPTAASSFGVCEPRRSS